MSDEFNPYRDWLGLEHGREPSSHYELLGIARDEGEPETIARKADALTARIRRIRPGPHLLVWQQLLDAVAQAKACLLDPTARGAYDVALRQAAQARLPFAEHGHTDGQARTESEPTEEAPPQADPPPEWPSESFAAIADTSPEWLAGTQAGVELETQPWNATPGDPPTEADLPRDDDEQPLIAAHGEYRAVAPRRPSASQWVLGVLTIVVLGLAAVFVFLLVKQRHQQSLPTEAVALGRGADPASETPAGGDRPKGPEGPSNPHPARPISGAAKPTGGSASLADEKAPREATGQNEKPRPAAEAKEPGEPKGLAPADPKPGEAVKQALARVRTAMGRRDLATARQQLKAASQHAQTPADEAEIARVETLLANLEEFWKGMRQVLASLQPTQEIVLGSTPAIVVSADQTSLTYRSEGANHTYTLKDMPGPVVLALARNGFAKAPSQKVLLGAFLAADAGGDPALARQLWEEAASQGEDVTELLPELGRPGAAPVAGKNDREPPPTDPAGLKKAKDAMYLRFQAEFDQATKVVGKTALARKLLDEGRADGVDPVSRFVLFDEARAQAVAAGKAALACEAIDALDTWFTIDPLAMKVSSLEALARSAVSIQGQREFADASMKTAIQAAQSQRPEDAQKLADLALSVARRSKNAALIRSVQTARQQLGAFPPSGKAEEKSD